MSKTVQHLGIIMDGNRRWAKANGKVAVEGHQAGYRALKELLRNFKSLDVPYVTLYAFSTENWQRSKNEVSAIMKLFRRAFTEDVQELIDSGARVKMLGSANGLDAEMLKLIDDVEQRTAKGTGGNLGICFNYGGRTEIAEAAQTLADAGEKITEESLSNAMYHAHFPDLDLIVRTSGEQRISNFMLWRAAYAEMKFTDTYWPDFTIDELSAILDEYAGRQRRFGS